MYSTIYLFSSLSGRGCPCSSRTRTPWVPARSGTASGNLIFLCLGKPQKKFFFLVDSPLRGGRPEGVRVFFVIALLTTKSIEQFKN